MTALDCLERYFGYSGFRSGQETLINDILAGKDVLGVMPTGAGKSVCFQIPALMMEGLTLIVSPLISLMKDQVNALTQSGVAAAFINSSLSERQISKALDNAGKGVYKLIYIAPERLLTPSFLAVAQMMKISMLTVDEAHCISQWGQDFRPSYSKIPEFISKLEVRPTVSAFTATATPRVREDISEQLALRDPTVLVAGYDRPNLRFEVQKPRDKYAALTSLLADKTDLSGIVYCSTRAAVEEVCLKLKHNGCSASRYHAGLTDIERRDNQDDFLYDRARIMVATNAFGMGIDKSNVSFVIHYNMPMDVESYYQEAGRAGRDGEPADCVLLYSGQDVHTNKWLIDNSQDAENVDKETADRVRERNHERLREMTFYCSTNDCLRRYILRYFGENPPNYCGNCGNCDTNFETADITTDAQKILSCVVRVKEQYGVGMIVDVLRGSKNERLLRLGFDRLSTYGISDKNEHQLRDIITHLIMTGYLERTSGEYPVIKLGQSADEVLRNGASVFMKMQKEQAPDSRRPLRGVAHADSKPVDKRLFACLKELRQKIANERGMPAYIIFSDRTLTDMCSKAPRTLSEFLGVSGVGYVKMEQYGEQFLNAIARIKDGNNEDE